MKKLHTYYEDVSDVLNGKREPGQAILTYLGLERVVSYREVEGK